MTANVRTCQNTSALLRCFGPDEHDGQHCDPQHVGCTAQAFPDADPRRWQVCLHPGRVRSRHRPAGQHDRDRRDGVGAKALAKHRGTETGFKQKQETRHDRPRDVQGIAECWAAGSEHRTLTHRRPKVAKRSVDHQQHPNDALRAIGRRRRPHDPSECDHQHGVESAEHHPEWPRRRADGRQFTNRLIGSAVAVPEHADEERHRDVQNARENPAGEQRLAPSFDAHDPVRTRRTAPLDAARVPRFPDAVTHSSKGDEQWTRKPREYAMSFGGSREASCERHDAMDAAFAVPATHGSKRA